MLIGPHDVHVRIVQLRLYGGSSVVIWKILVYRSKLFDHCYRKQMVREMFVAFLFLVSLLSFFSYPYTNRTAIYGIDKQFMWGDSLLITPALAPVEHLSI